MDHSLESYLGRQPTEVLEMLRQQCEEEDPIDRRLALLIRDILKKRRADALKK